LQIHTLKSFRNLKTVIKYINISGVWVSVVSLPNKIHWFFGGKCPGVSTQPTQYQHSMLHADFSQFIIAKSSNNNNTLQSQKEMPKSFGFLNSPWAAYTAKNISQQTLALTNESILPTLTA